MALWLLPSPSWCYTMSQPYDHPGLHDTTQHHGLMTTQAFMMLYSITALWPPRPSSCYTMPPQSLPFLGRQEAFLKRLSPIDYSASLENSMNLSDLVCFSLNQDHTWNSFFPHGSVEPKFLFLIIWAHLSLTYPWIRVYRVIISPNRFDDKCSVRWHTPVTPAAGGQRQEDHEI